jgi:hypothetical protein
VLASRVATDVGWTLSINRQPHLEAVAGPRSIEELVKLQMRLECGVITENGCAATDVITEDGRVYDSDRVMFLHAFLGQLHRATAEGVPVNGYFLWSSQDNFEWIFGYGNRFGIIYDDFDTLERKARWRSREPSATEGCGRHADVGPAPCPSSRTVDRGAGATGSPLNGLGKALFGGVLARASAVRETFGGRRRRRCFR